MNILPIIRDPIVKKLYHEYQKLDMSLCPGHADVCKMYLETCLDDDLKLHQHIEVAGKIIDNYSNNSGSKEFQSSLGMTKEIKIKHLLGTDDYELPEVYEIIKNIWSYLYGKYILNNDFDRTKSRQLRRDLMRSKEAWRERDLNNSFLKEIQGWLRPLYEIIPYRNLIGIHEILLEITFHGNTDNVWMGSLASKVELKYASTLERDCRGLAHHIELAKDEMSVRKKYDNLSVNGAIELVRAGIFDWYPDAILRKLLGEMWHILEKYPKCKDFFKKCGDICPKDNKWTIISENIRNELSSTEGIYISATFASYRCMYQKGIKIWIGECRKGFAIN